ncbi:MAG: hypothetical protein GQ570_11250 [Helicobacteraceae bacterium]|nr:hypothetical protein [Helicobacteraceae bacterium]
MVFELELSSLITLSGVAFALIGAYYQTKHQSNNNALSIDNIRKECFTKIDNIEDRLKLKNERIKILEDDKIKMIEALERSYTKHKHLKEYQTIEGHEKDIAILHILDDNLKAIKDVVTICKLP